MEGEHADKDTRVRNDYGVAEDDDDIFYINVNSY